MTDVYRTNTCLDLESMRHLRRGKRTEIHARHLRCVLFTPQGVRYFQLGRLSMLLLMRLGSPYSFPSSTFTLTSGASWPSLLHVHELIDFE